MRLNKLSFLLISLMCLSLISCGSNDSKESVEYQDEIDLKIQYQSKLFLEQHPQQLYQDSIKSVVSVIAFDDGNTPAVGSGFFCMEDEQYLYLITNHHVVENSSTVKVISYLGQVKVATVLGVDSVFDVALLRTEKFEDIKLVKFPNEDYTKIENPNPGDEVFIIGNPGALENIGTVNIGVVSGADRDPFAISSSFERADFEISVDITMNHGNSGGPLFNMNGEVIGINTYAATTINGVSYKGLNFSLPIQDALLIVSKIKEEGEFLRATLGYNLYIASRDLTLYEKQYLKLDSNFQEGIVVKGFGTNNILEVPLYSIITKVNGVSVNNLAEFRRQLYFAGPNTNVKISYYQFSEKGYDFYEREIVVQPKSLSI